MTGIDVPIQQVVYVKEIGPPKGPNRANILEYIVFGKDDEIFLAHRITQPPDFDQLLNVKISGGTLTEAQLKKGVLVTVPNRQNEPARRLKRGETVTARGRVTGEETVVSLEIMFSRTNQAALNRLLCSDWPKGRRIIRIGTRLAGVMRV